MPRYRLTIEYDGRPYVGWQRQSNGPSVQQALEEAAFRLTGQPTALTAAGRTDAGVHATGQVCHLDIERDFAPAKLRDALNAHLREHLVAVLEASRVEADFHARFSATGRAYLYRILNRRARPTLDLGRVWWHARPLDAAAMQNAARVLLGTHDFSSFRASECQAASPVKTLDRLDIARQGEEVHMIVEARSFLHHQVRNFAGTLALVGIGKWSADDLRQALEARDRRAGGPTAPPDGLYLTRVTYPTERGGP
ncbi:tRNA pseudouridine(38-40) synthase TruA [Oceanibaculum pacificum]|uniref:tRNA pseudouridine synthase A n=1 Tax=Oceanibaculum pacificum TaxID=580166 RepID=A0A154VYG9_9PROT|nr:tRNA pseudouridine(38-40) synthase TruA [Oceanibaculum pacificum]KZD06277.1 pseudouridine synthase [Oceanibaculum pacificum]